MRSVRFARADGPLGPMWIAATDRGIAAATRDDAPDAMLADLRRRFPGASLEADAVDARWLASGDAPALDTTGISAFDARVYEVVRGVPAGETVTYGDVALLIGAPGAARAVGGAMSRCPFFPAVPCHRVVRASDGWSGWGGDDRHKRDLLRREQR